jgi:selenocysteine lyase/cysteine desulfurase
VPGLRVLDRGLERAAIVTVSTEGIDAEVIVGRLRAQRINASASRAEYSVIDMAEKGAATAVRLSPHYYNTDEELDVVVAALTEAKSLR